MPYVISNNENVITVDNRVQKKTKYFCWGLIGFSLIFIVWVFTTDIERGVLFYPFGVLAFSIWRVGFHKVTIFDTVNKGLSLEKQSFFIKKVTLVPFADVRKIVLKPTRTGYRSTAEGSIGTSGPSAGVNGIILTQGFGHHKFYFEHRKNARRANDFAKTLANIGLRVEGRANRHGANMD